MIDELYLYPVLMNLIKAHGGKGSGPFSFERLATSPPQADHVLVDLFSSVVEVGLRYKSLRQYFIYKCTVLTNETSYI